MVSVRHPCVCAYSAKLYIVKGALRQLCKRVNVAVSLARSLSKSVTTLRSSAFSKERFAVVCAFPVKLDILKPVHDLTQRTLQPWKSFTSPRPANSAGVEIFQFVLPQVCSALSNSVRRCSYLMCLSIV